MVTLLRLPTGDGAFWFKANAIGTAHEGPLIAGLARWAPGHVLEPVAIDVRADLLDDDQLLRVGRPGGLTPEQRQRLSADAERYASLCAELAAIDIPASVNHDDLHDNNVFVPAESAGHYRVFDWGDASVTHPFAVLLIALPVVENLHHLPPGDAALLRLRDAYLEPWAAEFDRADLVEAVRLALRVGGLSRALSYRSALVEGTTADHDEFGDGLPQWLLEVYGPTPVEP